MHGVEYDELVAALEPYKADINIVAMAEDESVHYDAQRFACQNGQAKCLGHAPLACV